jgi:hypothetical protein
MKVEGKKEKERILDLMGAPAEAFTFVTGVPTRSFAVEGSPS